LFNLTIADNEAAMAKSESENAKLAPTAICQAMKGEIRAGNPFMVLQQGYEDANGKKGKFVGHAVVGFGYEETADKVVFWIADSNYPDQRQLLTFDSHKAVWTYYWTDKYHWHDFRVGYVSSNPFRTIARMVHHQ
jgi:hypothetical protein